MPLFGPARHSIYVLSKCRRMLAKFPTAAAAVAAVAVAYRTCTKVGRVVGVNDTPAAAISRCGFPDGLSFEAVARAIGLFTVCREIHIRYQVWYKILLIYKYIYFSGRGGTCTMIRPTRRGDQIRNTTQRRKIVRMHSALHSSYVYDSWVLLNKQQRRLPQESQNFLDHGSYSTVNKNAISSCVPTSCFWPHQPVPHHLLSWRLYLYRY